MFRTIDYVEEAGCLYDNLLGVVILDQYIYFDMKLGLRWYLCMSLISFKASLHTHTKFAVSFSAF